MVNIKSSTLILLCLSLIIFITAWLLQEKFLINWDVSNMMYIAKWMLNGGAYVKDFFNPNPPFSVYLYMPPVVISKLFNISQVINLRLYVFLLCAISYLACYFLCRRIFIKQDEFLCFTFLLMLLVIFLILPLFEFGQRDHLLIIFCMPYVLLVSYQLDGNEVNHKIAGMIGLFAIFGFVIKPQFLLTPVLIEAYFCINRRHWLAWVRVESVIMIVFLLFYAALLLFFYHDYIYINVPYYLKYLNNSMGISFSVLVSIPIVIYSFLSIIFYFFQYKSKPYKNLFNVLALTWLGFFYAYISQKTIFYYHILPFFSISCLLLVVQYTVLLSKKEWHLNDSIFIVILNALTLLFLFRFGSEVRSVVVLDPILYFSYFAILFFLLPFAVKNNNIVRAVLSTIFIILISWICSYLISHIDWYPYTFLLTFVISLILYSLFSGGRFSTNFIISLLASSLFAYPVVAMKNIYNFEILYQKNALTNVVDYIKSQGNNNHVVYFLSINGNYGSEVVAYTNSILPQHYEALWMLKQILTIRINKGDVALKEYIKNNHDKYFFFNVVTEDLVVHKPDIVFIDMRKINVLINKHPLKLNYSLFNLLPFFLENAKFNKEWHHYRYVATLKDDTSFLNLRVYKRFK